MSDQGQEGLLSPFLRRARFKAARPFLAGNILDFGCGSGTLARYIPPANYVGIDIDSSSLGSARRRYPLHFFASALDNSDRKFDTIVSLAVIEHVPDPVDFLQRLASHLGNSPDAKIIITTPHPSVDWVHHYGAAIGLFSKHASEEHEDLLDEQTLRVTGAKASLEMISYSRFLLGANQLAVFMRQTNRND